MIDTLILIRSLELILLFICAVLVMTGQGVCKMSDRPRAIIPQCYPYRYSIDMWQDTLSYSSWLIVQYVVVGLTAILFFTAIHSLRVAVDKTVGGVLTCCLVTKGIVCLVMAVLEICVAAAGVREMRVHEDRVSELGDKYQTLVDAFSGSRAFVESWVAASVIYIILTGLYMVDGCIFANDQPSQRQNYGDVEKRPNKHTPVGTPQSSKSDPAFEFESEGKNAAAKKTVIDVTPKSESLKGDRSSNGKDAVAKEMLVMI